MALTGRIHSTESFGTVDGPGIRFVVFMQGCPMRCLYCHNPDTWAPDGGTAMTADELLALYDKNRAFYKRGGLTVTGGEPLLQPEFVAELFCKAHEEGIHTCLDTSGITFSPEHPEKVDAVLDHTDLVLLDIKEVTADAHRRLTGHGNGNILAFARHLSDRGIPVWVRHVVVPGVTDSPEMHKTLGEFLATLSNVKALDVLPYHTMGEAKYKALGIPYPLAGVPAAEKELAVTARRDILAAYRAAKQNQA